MLKNKMLTDDPEVKAICGLYWELDEDDKFPHTVKEIANLVGRHSKEVADIIKASCEEFSLPNASTDIGKQDVAILSLWPAPERTVEVRRANIPQIQTLKKLRDTLLPNLMSGEVRARPE